MKYTVDFAPELSHNEIEEYCATHNITILRHFANIGNSYHIETDETITINDTIVSILADSYNGIQLLGIDVTLNDSTETATFSLSDQKEWWKVTSVNEVDYDSNEVSVTVRGQQATVYIMDSGIEISHPEFTESDIELTHSFVNDFDDNNGHGTAIASLIAGKTCAISRPKIKVIKVFDEGITTYQSDIIAALDAILADFINNGRKPAVVNTSWSIPFNEYINAKFQILINEGLYVVVSSGNSGTNITDVTPACLPGTIVIGSYNQNLEPSSFSNYTGGSSISYTEGDNNHGEITAWAPGEYIWTATLNETYGYTAGTSMAAAIASASIAYNVAQKLNDDGEFLTEKVKNITETANKLHVTLMTTRNSLLNLSVDPKYSNSNNCIVTFLVTSRYTLLRNLLIASAGSTKYDFMFFPHGTKRVTCDDPRIDGWLTLQDTGVFEISHPEISDPYVSIKDIKFDVENHHGDTFERFFDFVILRQNETTESILEELDDDDPIKLEYILEESLWCAGGLGNCWDPQALCYTYTAGLGGCTTALDKGIIVNDCCCVFYEVPYQCADA